MGARPSDFQLTTPGAFRVYSTTELLKLPPPAWMIDQILPAGGFIGLIGQPGAGKTFVALDLALSVATGIPWQGFGVEQGYVLYVCAEGSGGIGKRVGAWLHARDIRPTDAKIGWLTEAIDVHTDSESMAALVERVTQEIQIAPALIVIDTLARCLVGDEIMPEDMGSFVKGVDSLRAAFNAAVLVIHHTRLDGDRERGSTAFRGASDTMILIASGSKKGSIAMSCLKQKEAEEFEQLDLSLKLVEEYASCVVLAGRQQQKAQKESMILGVLRDKGPMSWDDWFRSTNLLGMSKSTFYRAFVKLKESSLIVKENGQYSVVVSSNEK